MAYDHQMDQLLISDRVAATNAGVVTTAVAKIAAWAPCLQPIEVRGVAFVFTTAATVTAAVIDFYRRPTIGSDTNRVLIKRLNATLGQEIIGNVIYADVEGTTIAPGEDIIAEVSTASTAGAGHAFIMYQTKWQQPLNNTKMIKIP